MFAQRKSLYIRFRKFHITDIFPKPVRRVNYVKFLTKKNVPTNNFHRKRYQTKQTGVICPLDRLV